MKFADKVIPVPKQVKIPDLVYLHKNELMIIEGECDYNLKKGIKQLDTFDDFESFTKQFLNECGVDIKNTKKLVVTDKYVSAKHPLYWGYYLSSTQNNLSIV